MESLAATLDYPFCLKPPPILPDHCQNVTKYDNINSLGLQEPCNKKRVTTYKSRNPLIVKWAHLDSNQGPPDYESGALTS
jgi:hypothetical protein